MELKEDGDPGALAKENLGWPDQLRVDEAALGGRLELKRAEDPDVPAQEDGRSPDQLREGDARFGGRLEPKFLAGA